MSFIRSVIFSILVAYVSKHLYVWLVDMGVGVPYNNLYPGECRIIPGIECGSEKISVTSDGLAFITNGFKMMTSCNPKYTQGKLYLFDFSAPEKNVVQLEIIHKDQFDLAAFDPHGMDIFESVGKEIVKVYVVNHAKHTESVEVFVYNRTMPGMIEHEETIRNEKFVCLNDIALVDENKFFITNFFKYCHAHFLVAALEFAIGMRTANVLFYDSGNASIVDDGGHSFNGIALYNNKLFVVANGNGFLHTYDKDERTNELSNHKKYPIGHHPDNIFIDKNTGEIYIGTFKAPLYFIMGLFNQSTLISGTGIKVKVNHASNTAEVEEILHDDGRKFVKGISTVAHYKGQYLLGSVHHKLGYCKEKSCNLLPH